MTTLKIMTAAAGLLIGGTSLAMAQYGGWYSGYGYAAAPLYDYAAPAYGYAAPAYAAPATAGTTVIIVTPGAPAYTAPNVVSPSLYAYAPGYWGGYGGYGWGGYGRWRAGWWR
jgi:hypothetical protein